RLPDRESRCAVEREKQMKWSRVPGPGSRLLLLFAVSCSFFSKTKNTIYTIDRVPPAAAPAAVRGTPIAINSIELPAGFDRKEVVVRKANNQLDVRGTQQWPASLSDVVLHTLAFDLADRLPPGMMILPGATKP